MKPTLKNLQEYLKNKDICLLGNSRSILKNKKDVDKHDIICRMNFGVAQDKTEYIGSRTDILFISPRLKDLNLLRKRHNAKYVIWMVEGRKVVINEIKERAIHNPPKDWQELNAKFPEGKKPSTGCVAINFILKYIKFKKLTIYGFDFFKSGTWYHQKGVSKPHIPILEEKLILEMLKDKPNVKMIIE